MPWQVFLAYAAALYPLWAMDRLSLASGIGLAFTPTDGNGPMVRAEALKEAYPVDG